MLQILRQIRRSFFLPGKVKTYIAYAVGEIALIMVGILLALQVSDWNQARKDRAEETQILFLLMAEFQENQERLKHVKEDHQNIYNGMKSFLEVIKPDPDPVEDELVHRNMALLTYAPPHSPNTVVMDSINASGKISLIRNQTLNYKLNTWPSALEGLESTQRRIVENTYHQFTPLLKYYHFRDSGHIVSDIFPIENLGPSNFSYDQKVLLALPDLENAVEFKRINEAVLLRVMDGLYTLQQEILDLIEAELNQQ